MICYQLEELENIANRQSGIYIICDKSNKPLYIGMSTNLRTRLDYKRIQKLYVPYKASHAYVIFEDQLRFTELWTLHCVEKKLIAFFNPPLNKNLYPFSADFYKDRNIL